MTINSSNNRDGDADLSFFKIFAESCRKMKEIVLGGGDALDEHVAATDQATVHQIAVINLPKTYSH